MKAIIQLVESVESKRVVEVSADLFDADGQVTDGIRYHEAVEQLRNLSHAVVSAAYGYHKDVE